MSEKKFDEVRKTKLRRIPSVASDPGEGKRLCRDIRKDVVVLPQSAEFVVGKRTVIVCRALPGGEDVDHFISPQGDDRAQHHAIDEGENGRVNANGKRKSKDCDGGETRRLDQLPESELEVLYHRQ